MLDTDIHRKRTSGLMRRGGTDLREFYHTINGMCFEY